MDKKPSNVSEEYPGCNAAETSERPPLFITIKERNALLIESVVLTEEEIKEAIIEGKRKKYFHNKHKAYWLCIAHAEKSQKIVTQENVQVVPESEEKQNQ